MKRNKNNKNNLPSKNVSIHSLSKTNVFNIFSIPQQIEYRKATYLFY